GFRLECHKKGDKVKLFSRRLDDMTDMFPELVEAIKKLDQDELIFEGEAMSYNEEKEEFRSFQETMRRRRKYEVDEMAEKYPLKLFIFDLMYVDGEDYTEKSYLERRKKLEEILSEKEETLKQTLRISEMKITSDPKEVEKLFKENLSKGLEGIIAKDPEASYKAGSRGWRWIKLKKSYEGELADTIDLLIVGYYKGKGSRTKFGFGGFLGCVYNKEKDRFETVAKVGTGFTEEQMKKFSEKLGEIKISEKPVRVDSKIEPDHWVEPRYVVTVNADEITKSPEHTCGKEGNEKGYALRFPRLEGWIRKDKNPEDATTVEEIKKMYRLQSE
ncbi:MAG: ATP-dependent DNA ligase, partial [archaeon]